MSKYLDDDTSDILRALRKHGRCNVRNVRHIPKYRRIAAFDALRSQGLVHFWTDGAYRAEPQPAREPRPARPPRALPHTQIVAGERNKEAALESIAEALERDGWSSRENTPAPSDRSRREAYRELVLAGVLELAAGPRPGLFYRLR